MRPQKKIRLGKKQQAWLDLICRSGTGYYIADPLTADLIRIIRLRKLGLVRAEAHKHELKLIPTKNGLAAWHKLTEKGDFKNVLYAPSKTTEKQK